MNNKLNVLLLRFANELRMSEIPLLRGAVLKLLEDRDDIVLFHNHLDDGERYSYPLIQYKRIGGRAAMVCVGEGAEEIGKFFSAGSMDVMLGERAERLEVDTVRAYSVLMQVWEDMFTYHLRKWLPLNQGNYAKYMAMESLAERYAMLENLLTANILSMAKGLGVHFERQVECKITAMEEPRLIVYKGVKMMAFDAEFKSNVSLPDYVGLGKGVSLGMGTVVRKREKKEYDSNNE